MCVLGYLGIAAGLHDGTQDSPLLWAALVFCGVGMGLSLSPLLAQALVHVPPGKAADAKGLLTTTMQLGQVTGVAAFGTASSVVPVRVARAGRGLQRPRPA
jgi:predicted MFS family arabinose efflux permease